MKTLAICYNIFDGAELLEKNIAQIRNYVDYILVNYQFNSYWGNKHNESDYEIIKNLYERKLIDQINIFKIEIYATSIPESKLLEREKRNIGRNILLEKKFDYALDVDVDEFYIEEEFRQAKEYILQNKIQYSAVQFKNYYHLSTIRSKNFSKAVIPFINVLNNKQFEGSNYFGFCDPTRGLTPDKGTPTYMFTSEEIYCHHMTNVRKDLYAKFQNTTLASLEKIRINEMVQNLNLISEENLETIDFNFDNLKREQLEAVPNIFSITI